MDSRLEERLRLADEQSNRLFQAETEYNQLDASEKALLAMLTLKQEGKSHAERETKALASQDWSDFNAGYALRKAEYNRERRRYELLIKAYDAEHLSFKIEEGAIRRQK